MVVWIWLLALLLAKSSICMKYSDWGKWKYDNSFQKTCMKHEWVKTYIDNNNARMASKDDNSNGKYAIFVFDDQHTRARKGGLGDRLSGLMTTFAFALRSNRTFLIEAHKDGLSKLFQPYQSKTQLPPKSWHNPTWSGFDDRQIHHKNKTYLWCVNPKPSQTICALDKNNSFAHFQVVRVRINRSYLCRWAENEHIPAHSELRDVLGITSDTNLFEVGGCMLRLALAPTTHLWDELDRIFESHMPSSAEAAKMMTKPRPVSPNTAQTTVVGPYVQVGFHYRCGDHNYKSAHLHPDMANHMQCAVTPGDERLEWCV